MHGFKELNLQDFNTSHSTEGQTANCAYVYIHIMLWSLYGGGA